MSKTVIQLERRNGSHADPGELERAYLLIDGNGDVIAFLGPEVSCAIHAKRCRSTLVENGYDPDEFVVSPIIWVDAETIEMYVRSWGRDSREGILRQAREICEHHGVSLSAEASTERFDKAGDRELAAALWFLWLDRGSTGLSLGNCAPDAGFCKEEVCQIGAFVFCLDEEGRVTAVEFPSVSEAAAYVSEVRRQWRPKDEPLPSFLDGLRSVGAVQS
jgi:hypothetical protein